MPGCYRRVAPLESRAAAGASRYDALMADTLSNQDLLAKLVSFDTTSINPNAPLADFICDYVDRPGVRIDRDEHDDGAKVNLLVMAGPEPDESRRGLLLSGHMDVVPTEGQPWTTDPFRVVERAGRLYGRGTADMKGFVGAVLALVPEFAAAPLKRPLHFAFSYDEEVGCVGVRSLLEDLREQDVKPALAIIGEPTEMRVVGGHKAGAVAITAVKGREGHSSAPASQTRNSDS